MVFHARLCFKCGLVLVEQQQLWFPRGLFRVAFEDRLEGVLALEAGLANDTDERGGGAPCPLQGDLLLDFEEVKEQAVGHFGLCLEQVLHNQPEIEGRQTTNLQQFLELHAQDVMHEEHGLSRADRNRLQKGVLQKQLRHIRRAHCLLVEDRLEVVQHQ